MTPAGLSQLQRPFLTRIVVLYTLLMLLALAIPAIALHPRGESPHPTDNQALRSVEPGATARR